MTYKLQNIKHLLNSFKYTAKIIQITCITCWYAVHTWIQIACLRIWFNITLLSKETWKLFCMLNLSRIFWFQAWNVLMLCTSAYYLEICRNFKGQPFPTNNLAVQEEKNLLLGKYYEHQATTRNCKLKSKLSLHLFVLSDFFLQRTHCSMALVMLTDGPRKSVLWDITSFQVLK